MRREEVYLADIVEAASAIERFLSDVQPEAFKQNELLQSAVLQKLTLIGEAASRLPQSFRERHLEVEWSDIIGFRNIAVHEYFDVDWSIVWATATDDAPKLRRQIAEILAQEYPDSTDSR
jgi:uncharacterized protein with HEPN domain